MEKRMRMYYKKYQELRAKTEAGSKEKKADDKQIVETVGKGK